MEKITLSKRLGSMLIDHIAMCGIAALIGIPLMILGFFSKRYFNVDLNWIAGILIFAIYFNKDFFRGKSIGKRTIGLIVITNKGDEVATRLQCFIRNLTIILFPLEVLISLFSRQRRIGDLLAGTKIEISNKEAISTIIAELKLELKKKNIA
ncbi:RDD family protein [Candidatus Amoebophilus asiaticus]|nr:RDD family protein [Candidatus Amoebophilus asiaticus]